MSFSGDVKAELCKRVATSRHCQLSELAAILLFAGRTAKAPENADGGALLVLEPANAALLRKCFTLLKKSFSIERVSALSGDTRRRRALCFAEEEMLRRVTDGLKLRAGETAESGERSFCGAAEPLLLKKSCCQRAFLRGAFLCAGSMSDPEKGYHMEFVVSEEAQAAQLKSLIRGFGVEAKVIGRKRNSVVYIKESAGIVDLLNVMEAPRALMRMENLRIIKEMRNSVNRRVNCETANIYKTVTAAEKQIADIQRLRTSDAYEELPGSLREMAELRLAYPDASLKELGELLKPPIGKSGVNHRLRKLMEIAGKNAGSL